MIVATCGRGSVSQPRRRRFSGVDRCRRTPPGRDGRMDGQRDGISPQNDLPLGTGRHAAGRLPASIYQRRPHPEYCLSFCQEANQINKGTNGGGGGGKSVGLVLQPPVHAERWSVPARRGPACHLFPRSACTSPPGSLSQPPGFLLHRMISPSLIYGSLSALLSLHPRTHSSNCSS